MLPLLQKILFLIFAAITGAFGFRGFRRVYLRIAAGRPDTEDRTNHLLRRILYSLSTTLTQSRTFRKRPRVSFFHSFIFYGFAFYLLVNLLDAIDGFVPLSFQSLGLLGNLYILARRPAQRRSSSSASSRLSFSRFLLPSRNDFRFNPRTLLHKDVRARYITRDSLIVSTFILFHVGSRAVGAGAKLAAEGPDRFRTRSPPSSRISSPRSNALAWRIFGYWGALGSVLAFLAYFPYTKHIHIFLAPAKYLVARDSPSGVLPSIEVNMDAEEPALGAPINSKISPGPACSMPTPASSAIAARMSVPPLQPANP